MCSKDININNKVPVLNVIMHKTQCLNLIYKSRYDKNRIFTINKIKTTHASPFLDLSTKPNIYFCSPTNTISTILDNPIRSVATNGRTVLLI